MKEVPECSSLNNSIPGSNASKIIHATVRHGAYQRPSAPAEAAKAATIGSNHKVYLGASAACGTCAKSATRATPAMVTDAVDQSDLLPDITAYGTKIIAIGHPTTQQTTTIRSLIGSGADS
jgi:hypothetical protein